MKRKKTRLMKGLVQLISLGLLVIVTISCVTTGKHFGTKARLEGMIYDTENRPIPGYEIGTALDAVTETDITGRFFIDDVPFGTIVLFGRGSRHINVDQKIAFSDPRHIAYLRVPSRISVYSEIDENLSHGKLEKAFQKLQSLPDEELTNPIWNFYTALYNWLASNDAEKDCFFNDVQKWNARVQHD